MEQDRALEAIKAIRMELQSNPDLAQRILGFALECAARFFAERSGETVTAEEVRAAIISGSAGALEVTAAGFACALDRLDYFADEAAP